MAVMAFLETTIPPVTLVFPGEWAVLFGGAMAGEGSIAIIPLLLVVWACSAAGDSVTFALGRRLGRPFLNRYGRRLGLTEARLDRLDTWLDRYGPPAVCFGRLLPLARPFGPLVAGASHFPYRRFLPWSVLGTLLFTLVFCGLGYVVLQLIRRGGRDPRPRRLRRPPAHRRGARGPPAGPAPPCTGGCPLIRALTLAVIVAAVVLVALVMFDGGGGYKVSARFENAGPGGQRRPGRDRRQEGRDGHRPAPDRRRPGRARADDRRRLGAAAAGHPRPDPPVRAVRPGQPLRGPEPARLARARGAARRRGARDRGHHGPGRARPALRHLRQAHPRLAARGVPRLGAPVRGPGRGGERGLALPRPGDRLRQPPVRRADPGRGRAPPLPRASPRGSWATSRSGATTWRAWSRTWPTPPTRSPARPARWPTRSASCRRSCAAPTPPT